MSNTLQNMEIEIKLKLGSFTDYLKLLGFLGQIEREEHHINGFFDSEDRRLAKAGWALRVRAENSRGTVTLKSIPTTEGLAVIRQEIESQIERSEATEVLALQRELLSLPVMPVQHVVQLFPDIHLARLIQFENCRQKKLFRIGDHNYLLEVDRTEYGDGSVDYELELELSDTSKLEQIESNLRKMFDALGIPFERQTESKFARALKKAKIYLD